MQYRRNVQWYLQREDLKPEAKSSDLIAAADRDLEANPASQVLKVSTNTSKTPSVKANQQECKQADPTLA